MSIRKPQSEFERYLWTIGQLDKQRKIKDGTWHTELDEDPNAPNEEELEAMLNERQKLSEVSLTNFYRNGRYYFDEYSVDDLRSIMEPIEKVISLMRVSDWYQEMDDIKRKNWNMILDRKRIIMKSAADYLEKKETDDDLMLSMSTYIDHRLGDYYQYNLMMYKRINKKHMKNKLHPISANDVKDFRKEFLRFFHANSGHARPIYALLNQNQKHIWNTMVTALEHELEFFGTTLARVATDGFLSEEEDRKREIRYRENERIAKEQGTWKRPHQWYVNDEGQIVF